MLCMQRLFLFAGVLATASLILGTMAHADPASKRHLVYNFTVGINSSQHMNESAAGTNDNNVNANVSDKGQIIVDYLGVQTDGGLVVNVAEKAQTNRTLAPTLCIVYPNTNVQCGGGGNIN